MNNEIIISPYGELEKHIINGKIENIVYHVTDWGVCFGTKSQNYVPNENAKITTYTAQELNDRLSQQKRLLWERIIREKEKTQKAN